MHDPGSSYSPPGYGQSSSATAPPARKRKSRAGLIVGLVVVALLIAVAGVAVLHYFGPVSTVQAFFKASLVSYDGQSAYATLCPEAQAKLSESQLQATLDRAKSIESPWNLANVTYTLVDENLFGDAHVRIGGSATATVNGQLQTFNFNLPDKDIFTLHSAGLGWCLTDTNLTLTS